MDAKREASKKDLHAIRQQKQNIEREVDNKLLMVTEMRSTYPSCLSALVDRETNFRFQRLTKAPIISSYQAEIINSSDCLSRVNEAMLARRRSKEDEERIEELYSTVQLKKKYAKGLDVEIRQKILPLL